MGSPFLAWLRVAWTDRRIVGGVCVLIVGGFLIAGWWPFDPFPPNAVSWLDQTGGLAFKPQAVAYDEQPLPGFVAGAQPAGLPSELRLGAGPGPHPKASPMLRT